MIVLALDIETTGLNPERHQILEIGAILARIGGPTLEVVDSFRVVIHRKEFIGQATGLLMNAKLLSECSEGKDAVPEEVVAREFAQWLHDKLRRLKQKRVTLAGKNLASFDLRFLEKLNGWPDHVMRRRILDIGPMFLEPGDVVVPNLATCLARAGLPTDVKHTAIEDCLAVLRCAHFKLRRSEEMK